jgi:hypothetical protein
VSLSAKNTGGQYLVKINLDKTDSSVLGMFVNVQFPLKTKQKLPKYDFNSESALIRQGQLTGIYTIGNGNVILRWLRTGKTLATK